MGYDDAVREAFDQREAALAKVQVRRAMTGRRARMVGRASVWCARCWSTRSTATTGSPTGRSCAGGSSSASPIVVGATILGLSFSTEQGSREFYLLTFALAATWALGSVASGPLHLGHIVLGGVRRRPIFTPIIVGLLLAALFVAGGLVIRDVPFLARLTEDVLGYARYGTLWLVAVITLVNGIAEELFFRGALFAAIGVRTRCSSRP